MFDAASPTAFVEHVLHVTEIVLVMMVDAGFGGQASLPKIRALRARVFMPARLPR
jgi:pentose-5-phosphate-3-epimerase